MKTITLCADDFGQNEAISQGIINLINHHYNFVERPTKLSSLVELLWLLGTKKKLQRVFGGDLATIWRGCKHGIDSYIQ